MRADSTPPCRHLLVLATLALAGCSPAPPAKTAAALPQVVVVTVHRATVPVSIELPARTSPFLVAQIRARVDGIVQQRAYREGSDVKAGQRLYAIDPAPYVTALQAARAGLQKAQANVVSATALAERDKVLADANVVSKQDYDNAVAARAQAEADVATGQAAVRAAQINLDYTTVLSPITGRSGPSLVTQGAYVQGSAATLMTTVQQIDPMYVDITQSSVDGLQLRQQVASGRLKAGSSGPTRVTLTLEDGTAYPVSGTLQFSDISVNPATGSITLRALFPNPRMMLLPGSFVRARIDEGVRDDALLVPQAGVTHDAQGQATALVVGTDNRVARRTLQLQGTQGDRWVVVSGLQEGERVIVAGLQKVKPGAQVLAKEAAATSVAAK
ncbi:efflux RND transporter periplasmic adaptor subunit [Ramlibacter sp.]|uniref:efflux RND transporter periplasmic adaptor subunit n=1 Tax=Ramlibacter sp. TaxID=1917967 RepID=UPI0026064E6B|nr:efflux RND transporter periplasmic adaptor subunit [Ramlibacter sp.]MDB5955850.1 efflux transporter periplasmic adaptor subunit [Ramlibacter sp.]